jgi:predicted ribonuclease YlaK
MEWKEMDGHLEAGLETLERYIRTGQVWIVDSESFAYLAKKYLLVPAQVAVVNPIDRTKQFVSRVDWDSRTVDRAIDKVFHPDHKQNPAARNMYNAFIQKSYKTTGISSKNPKTQRLTILEIRTERKKIG